MAATNQAYADNPKSAMSNPASVPYPTQSSEQSTLAYPPPPAYQPHQPPYQGAAPYHADPSYTTGANVGYVQYGYPGGYDSTPGAYQPVMASDTSPSTAGKRDVEAGHVDTGGILSFDTKSVRLGRLHCMSCFIVV